MLKKNDNSKYAKDEQNLLILDTKAIITSIIITLVTGAIGGAIVTMRVTDSNTYRITTISSAVEKLDELSIKKEVYIAQQENIDKRLTRIETLLERISTRF